MNPTKKRIQRKNIDCEFKIGSISKLNFYRFSLSLPPFKISSRTDQINRNQNQVNSSSNYASSEDEQNKYQRLDSTASYTSEDETPITNNPQEERSFVSQQSETESISYYNPESFDDEQQSYYTASESIKRTYSYTSDEAEESVSFKRQKLR